MEWSEISDTIKGLPGLIRRKMESPTRRAPPESEIDHQQLQQSQQKQSPVRRVKGQLIKKESATFQLDGATYTIVASPPERPLKDEKPKPSPPHNSNGQLNKQGPLTIVRRSSGRNASSSSPREASSASVEEEVLESLDLDSDHLPPVDTPDACDKAAIRLRALLWQLQRGEIAADMLQKNLLYAAKVLEAVFIDETKAEPKGGDGVGEVSIGAPEAEGADQSGRREDQVQKSGPKPCAHHQHNQRRLRAPVWASSSSPTRRLADEDDELSEVQPDAVPPEVREWLASTFTRQLGTTRRRADEKPKFKSVAHAIRAGIFVDRIYRRVTSTALLQFPAEVVKVLKTLDEWSFDVFALNESASCQPIKYLTYELLNRYGILHKFKVVPSTLENFLGKIEEGYCRFKNPYHNNLHATDVAQTVHFMLCKIGLMNWLTDLEIFSTLIAAIIHDFEHTGTTNNFHVMSGSDTALLYNDRAVLENHHISASFRLLKDDDCNILQNLSREEYREFRTLVIDMVLATDMSFHFQQLKNMKNLLSLAEPTVDKSKALSLVLHCCDISHPAKRWDLHHKWTTRLLEEFFRQGDKERDLGLPFSPLCDRNNIMIAESQIGFIDFIVDPSMAVCSDMLETLLAPVSAPNNPGCDSKKNNVIGSENQDPENPFVMDKPWIPCLAENKRIWKEKAVHEAAQSAEQKNSEPEEIAKE
ncbi:dual specificity calcium/calmodulin-dependent 3',5'-cyclic nucleotide phosphodiesterase 1-like isoform X3 [Rhodnius prolixus]|uniref:dual specificity calcium/calmodulin-dependent 3',5'-cyclic nucleotide phosphodiesterase 1-like isoform X3 n=1 Tax=Rhodnius prolixus TaxID=13249 RepID=UPI003D18971B